MGIKRVYMSALMEKKSIDASMVVRVVMFTNKIYANLFSK